MFDRLFNIMFVRTEVKKRKGSLPVCELVRENAVVNDFNSSEKTIDELFSKLKGLNTAKRQSFNAFV